jgi:hypothetical protein
MVGPGYLYYFLRSLAPEGERPIRILREPLSLAASCALLRNGQCVENVLSLSSSDTQSDCRRDRRLAPALHSNDDVRCFM